MDEDFAAVTGRQSTRNTQGARSAVCTVQQFSGRQTADSRQDSQAKYTDNRQDIACKQDRVLGKGPLYTSKPFVSYNPPNSFQKHHLPTFRLLALPACCRTVRPCTHRYSRTQDESDEHLIFETPIKYLTKEADPCQVARSHGNDGISEA